MRSLLVSLLVVLAALLVATVPTGRPGEAAPATPQPTATVEQSPGRSQAAPATPQPAATVQRSPGRAGRSPTLLGDINNDGIVDVRDYGIWRQQFGATDCGNVADLNFDCIVDVRDYGIWRQQFGQTGPTVTPTPVLTGRAYVTTNLSNNPTV